MNELVIQKDGKATTTSLIVADEFHKKHFNVMRDIKNLECSAEFKALNFEFVEIIEENAIGGHAKKNYYEMTRDGFTFLAMGFTGKKAAEFKEKFINAFNKMENALRTLDPMKVLNDPAAMRNLLLTYTEKVLALESTVAEQKPKVEALDFLVKSDDLYGIRQTVKCLQARGINIPEKKLTRWFEVNKWMYRLGKGLTAYSDKIHAGLLFVQPYTYTKPDGTEGSNPRVYITTKGLTKLAREFGRHVPGDIFA